MTYHNHAGLLAWLNASPFATSVFYYDNVDFDVALNDATLTTTGTPITGAKIVLKYPLSPAKVTVTGWTANTNAAGSVESLTKN